MKAVIRVIKTKEVIFEGVDMEDCKNKMRPAFMAHIAELKPIHTFGLEIVDLDKERDDMMIALAHTQALEAEEEQDDYQSRADIEARDFHDACGDR